MSVKWFVDRMNDGKPFIQALVWSGLFTPVAFSFDGSDNNKVKTKLNYMVKWYENLKKTNVHDMRCIYIRPLMMTSKQHFKMSSSFQNICAYSQFNNQRQENTVQTNKTLSRPGISGYRTLHLHQSAFIFHIILEV